MDEILIRLEAHNRGAGDIRMEDMSGVIHAVLESAIEMRKRLGTAAKAHVLAEVVSALGTVVAVVAHNAGLDCNPLSDDEVFYTRTDGGYDSC